MDNFNPKVKRAVARPTESVKDRRGPMSEVIDAYHKAAEDKRLADMSMRAARQDMEYWCQSNPREAFDLGYLTVNMKPNPRK